MAEELVFEDLCCGPEILDSYQRAISQASYAQKDQCSLGRVIRLDRSFPLVLTQQGALRAEHAADLKKHGDKLSAVGDWVVLAQPEGQDLPIIIALLPRGHVLHRKEAGAGEQTLAANVDVVFLVSSLQDDGVNIRHLERMLVVAHESGAQPVIVLSKADGEGIANCNMEEIALRAGDVPVIMESAQTGAGIEEIRALIPEGSSAVLLGKSGVGKSTLVNALVGEERCETGAVRAGDGKGRHTTVAREMVKVPGGGIIIDTPGLRALNIWDVSRGLEAAYRDVLAFEGQCRFRDCTHMKEPGCGVVAAVEQGLLPACRLESYRALAQEAAQAAKAEEERSWR